MSTVDERTGVDRQALEAKVKEMYSRVANEPDTDFHFEMGRGLAERLGYRPDDLDRIPREAVDSFAGVGYHLDLAGIEAGQVVVDLGSGSGMDTFIAALKALPGGHVIGVDMTEAQRTKASHLAATARIDNVEFREGYIETPPVRDGSADVVISNGVINLSAEKERVFAEAARLLRPGGRLALSDIVTEAQLPGSVKCDATLWAACIGGAMQQDDYLAAITRAALEVAEVRANPQYHFLTEAAQGASRRFGVKSVSVLAIKR
ncbi:methyltransferase domain-containing protein [Alkalilimnicola ehrlichii MLHE-1]|uniref:Arsenite methyltransferase n=1 Tax=Alkalilimnicola ehrlichii (strain ATCC BAA-1101 / DSM 17681 / MLHE-1) TaxID=187272 RepID=Q0A855_ALKEH|nr:methyltransferase domain-containing protein [Alkalilimnicola ehrlichii]ABI56982.1 Methyltransferase type 11 [Alkalilimnicola ehrlichii MLHE-1]